MSTITNQSKNDTTITNRTSTSLVSNLWDENNTPWSPDSNLPWQDEEMVIKTIITNREKK